VIHLNVTPQTVCQEANERFLCLRARAVHVIPAGCPTRNNNNKKTSRPTASLQEQGVRRSSHTRTRSRSFRTIIQDKTRIRQVPGSARARVQRASGSSSTSPYHITRTTRTIPTSQQTGGEGGGGGGFTATARGAEVETLSEGDTSSSRHPRPQR
jgi:hypothetical protein